MGNSLTPIHLNWMRINSRLAHLISSKKINLTPYLGRRENIIYVRNSDPKYNFWMHEDEIGENSQEWLIEAAKKNSQAEFNGFWNWTRVGGWDLRGRLYTPGKNLKLNLIINKGRVVENISDTDAISTSEFVGLKTLSRTFDEGPILIA